MEESKSRQKSDGPPLLDSEKGEGDPFAGGGDGTTCRDLHRVIEHNG